MPLGGDDRWKFEGWVFAATLSMTSIDDAGRRVCQSGGEAALVDEVDVRMR
jgi:hypothetical protein